jgi:hypothetical protein
MPEILREFLRTVARRSALREPVVHLPVGGIGEVCGLAKADNALLIEGMAGAEESPTVFP